MITTISPARITKTPRVSTRAVQRFAQRDGMAITQGSGALPFSYLSTLFGSLATELKSRFAWAPKLQSARRRELLTGVAFAAIMMAITTGCGGSSGPTASAAVIQPAPPSILPGTGTYTGAQQVTINDATQGTAIYYTVNGTVPTASSTAYAGAFSITVSSTVQAIAILRGVSSATASSVLTITPAHPPAILAFVQQPSNTLAGVTISPAVQVMVQDASGNVVTTATNPVTLALTAGTGLGGTLTVTPQNGIAEFSNLTVSTVGSYTLLATSSGLTPATSSSFTVDAPAKLAFIVQPSNVLTGTAIAPAVQVAIQDANGKTVTADSSPVKLALAGSSTNLAGTVTVPAQNGVATFSNLTVSTAGNYALSATSANLSPATSASFTVTFAAVTYYLSPTGSDSNSGLSTSEPWLSPNHAVNCGDMIIAASSTAYDQQNFTQGKWGPVTCAPGATANVAWLKCETFDSCKLTANYQNAMWVTSSYWGVQGWEVSATGGQAVCFASFPPTSTANLHHIIFANDIANSCYGAGFENIPNGSAGTDYFVLIGNIAYNAAQQTTQCGSGISIFEPAQSDTLPGTHIYVAGNYTWDNIDANPCAGGTPSDGEGIIFDTFDANNYTQQAVMVNNVAFLNGASGFRVDKTTQAPVYVVNNTAFGNNTDTNLNTIWCGEITLQESKGISVSNNVARSATATGCGANPNYALYVANGDASDVVATNIAYGIAGQDAGQSDSVGFFFAASNLLGIDPLFANPPTTNPGPPNCAGSTSVAQCMSSTFSGLLPQAPSAIGLGIQPLGGAPTVDPLFPSWLCNVGLPPGLIPNHCP
jgi:Chitobiase/beta-hexosaminidase C-terminal domain